MRLGAMLISPWRPSFYSQIFLNKGRFYQLNSTSSYRHGGVTT